jgi:peroxiredoxin
MNHRPFRSAREAQGLQVGDQAPLFEATDQFDEHFELSKALEKGPVVLIFYRGQWCPFCNAHLRKLQDNLPSIYKKGASVVAISPETSDFLRRTMQKTGAQFRLLHDNSYSIADAYDVTFRPGGAQRLMYNTVLGANLKQAHADDQELLPIPATYIIDTDRRIVWRHFNPDYKRRSKITDILSALSQL